MLNAGESLAAVLQTMKVSESMFVEAESASQLEDGDKRRKTLLTNLSLDRRMLRQNSEGNW